jgi:hypothetical protein
VCALRYNTQIYAISLEKLNPWHELTAGHTKIAEMMKTFNLFGALKSKALNAER